MGPKPGGQRSRAPEPGVEVQIATRAAAVPRGADLAGWVQAAGARAPVTVRLTGWPESRRLNERFRGKPGPANVLAFPAGAGVSPAGVELGDVVICLPLVYREAREQGKRPLQHLAHLVVHGTLHLLGYDHDQDPAARKMENAEVRILRRLGFPNPYRPVATTRAVTRRCR
jgi:probable rRNA maturation factor